MVMTPRNKQKICAVLSALLLLLPLSACRGAPPADPPLATAPGSDPASDTPQDEPVPEAPETGVFDISDRTAAHEYHAEDGTLLVRASALYPQLSGTAEAVQIVNDYYKNAVERLFSHAEFTLAPMADDARAAGADGMLLPYTADYRYEVMANNGRLLSVMHENSEFTGGLHETPVFSSETFDMRSGGLLTLADLFTVPEEEYLALFFDAAAEKIAQTPEEYFDITPQLLQESFNPSDFYVTDTGLTFYYQVYAIAPYATGLSYFTLPFDDIRNMLDPTFIS